MSYQDLGRVDLAFCPSFDMSQPPGIIIEEGELINRLKKSVNRSDKDIKVGFDEGRFSRKPGFDFKSRCLFS